MPDISTDREVKAAKTAGETPVEFTVKGAPGLRLRVTPRGFKSWSLLYTRSNDSKRCRIRLGEYPAMGLADAKRKVTELRARIQDGEDPAAAKQEARTAITLGELAASYLERHAKAKKRSWREDERMLNYDLLPAFGATKAAKLAKDEITGVLNRKKDDGAGYQANRLLSLVRHIYNWGIGEGLVEANPVLGIRQRINEEARTRTLSDEEIARFWHGLDGAAMTDAVRTLLRLALLTGQRVNEIAGAELDEFNFMSGVWTIPGRRTKNGLDHAVPLAPKALAMFQEAFAQSGSRYAFSGRCGPLKRLAGDDAAKPVGKTAATRAWCRARGRLGMDDVHVHDLRRTFATGLGNMDEDDFAIGLCLNHQASRSKITGGHYNMAKYLVEKRRLFVMWEAKLAAVIGEGEPRGGVLNNVAS